MVETVKPLQSGQTLLRRFRSVTLHSVFLTTQDGSENDLAIYGKPQTSAFYSHLFRTDWIYDSRDIKKSLRTLQSDNGEKTARLTSQVAKELSRPLSSPDLQGSRPRRSPNCSPDLSDRPRPLRSPNSSPRPIRLPNSSPRHLSSSHVSPPERPPRSLSARHSIRVTSTAFSQRTTMNLATI